MTSVLQEFALAFDQRIFFFVQGHQHTWLEPLFSWPTHIGDIGILLILLGTGILVFDRPLGYKRVIPILAITILEHSFMRFMKAFFLRPRPFDFWASVNVLGHRPSNESFPSGHTSDVVAAVFLLNYFYPGKVKWTWAVAGLVAFTRVYRGVHYPTDLIGGAALGVAFASVAIVFLSVTRVLPKITSAPKSL
jgi:undecaprenyl-diphosphatase